MTEVFIRNIIGLLAQIVPCATLCLVPFRGRLRTGTRRARLKAGAIVAVGLVPFLLVATMPVPDATYFWVLVRKTCQNLVFLAIVVALLVLYAREVDADRSHKAFAFSLVALYGFLVTFTTSNASALLRLDEGSDGFMYPPGFLIALVIVNAVFFLAMIPVMHALRRAFDAHISPPCGGA